MTEHGTYLPTWITGRSWHRWATVTCEEMRQICFYDLDLRNTVAISSVLGLNKLNIWHCGEWKISPQQKLLGNSQTKILSLYFSNF